MKLTKKILTLLMMAILMGWSFWVLAGDQFPVFRGDNGRAGLQVNSPDNNRGGITQETPGRAKIRWWDPTLGVETLIDDWMTGTQAAPAAAWHGAVQIPYAYNATTLDAPNHPPYQFAFTTLASSIDQPWQAANNLATFSWTVDCQPGQLWSFYVNLPVGPSTYNSVQYGSARYQVYAIEGVENVANPGQPLHDVLDTFIWQGSEAQVGTGGKKTGQTFRTTGTKLTVRLFNTVPLDADGRPKDQRSNIAVYADSCRFVRSDSAIGRTTASPVVGYMTQVPIDDFPYRVLHSRTEGVTIQVGSEARTYNFGTVSSFRHNGYKVDPKENGIGGEIRRNYVWGWPATRPLDESQAEVDRYQQEKRDFILGIDNNNITRADQIISMDDSGFGVTTSTGWTPQTAADAIGGEYLSAPGSSGAATAKVTFRPVMPDDVYALEIHIPSVANLVAQTNVQYTIGGLTGSTFVPTTGAGWYRVTLTDNTIQFIHNQLSAPLVIAITNATGQSSDVGKTVAADAIRFLRNTDFSTKSTPLMTTIPVTDSSGTNTKDVAIVALENGHIYCLDADGLKGTDSKGNFIFTGKTKVYWAYPSEKAAGQDPNQTATLDGIGGVTQMPTGFGLSSPLVQQVNGQYRLYIGTSNGRVFCLDTKGRGDGTTSRIWSWPDDFPATASTLDVGQVAGSVSYSNASGKDLIYVPTTSGRLYALDAVGNANHTTSINWQYPASTDQTIGPITMTPAVAFGKVFFGVPKSSLGVPAQFLALNVKDTNGDGVGDVVWSSQGDADVPFTDFGSSSPVVGTATDLGDSMPDTVFTAVGGILYALNAADGTTIWADDELGSGVTGSLGLSYLNTYTTLGVYDYDRTLGPQTPPGRPQVIVPAQDGRILAFNARLNDANASVDNATLNANRKRRHSWGYQLLGKNLTSPAFGGHLTGYTPPAPNYDEEYAYLYIADESGTVYGFSDDQQLPDNSLTITPGIVPVSETIPPNDPVSADLSDVLLYGKMALMLPSDYDTLKAKIDTNTLTWTDVMKAVTTTGKDGGPAKIKRTAFEYGEFLYAVAYNLPTPPTTGSRIQIQSELRGSYLSGNAATGTPVETCTGAPDDTKRGVSIVAVQTTMSGNNGMPPGPARFVMRATLSPIAGRVGGGGNMEILRKNTLSPFNGDITLANPLGVAVINGAPTRATTGFGDTQIGVFLDPAASENLNNGNPAVQDPDFATSIQQPLVQYFGHENDTLPRNHRGEPLPHGSTGKSVVFVYDRSAFAMLNPQAGLANVRTQLSDLAWSMDLKSSKDLRLKTLSTTTYPNFEDDPRQSFPNRSLDYPDIRRENLLIAAQQSGATQNPAFQPVSLRAPNLADLTGYRTDANVYNLGVPRSLVPTEFNVELSLPRFQPPKLDGAAWNGKGYAGDQILFIDSNNTAFFNPLGNSYRQVRLQASVQFDERLTMNSPVVDLGPTPAGANLVPGAPGTVNPNLFTQNGFRIPYQEFEVLNEGNVNLLNVRVAKKVQDNALNYLYPFSQMGSAELSATAFLDATLHLHSDLDPVFTPAAYNGQRIIQKARVGDGFPTRLRLDPPRRGNPNIPVGDNGYNKIQNPHVAVSVPIGAPSGNYSYDTYVFEDTEASANAPVLGVRVDNSGYESYTDPGFQLRFKVRETRLTSRPTFFSGAMMENIPPAQNQRLFWSSQEPEGFRDRYGNLIVAFSSDRQDDSGNPTWNVGAKAFGSVNQSGPFYLYVGSVTGGVPASNNAFNPYLNDLEQWAGPNNNQWFTQSSGPFPSGNLDTLFGVQPGEKIDPKTVRFGYPAFATNGAFSAVGNVARGEGANAYMTFIGEGMNTKPSGEIVRESRLFICTVSTTSGGGVTISNPIALTSNGASFDSHARFGRPTLVQNAGVATVFFTTSSAGQSQLNYAVFAGGQWQNVGGGPVSNIQLGAGFEPVGGAAVVVRPYALARPATDVLQVAFTARVRGKETADVLLGSVGSASGVPINFGPAHFIPWQVFASPLEKDPTSGLYWSIGAELSAQGADLGGQSDPGTVIASATALPFIDILRQVPGGYSTVLVPNSKLYDNSGRALTAETIYGGPVAIDLSTGSVKFTGGLVRTQDRLFLRMRPRFVRVSGNGSYRGVSMIYDSRPQTDLIYSGANSYTFDGTLFFDPNAQNVSVDRYVLATNKESVVAQTGVTTTPVFSSIRFGAVLRYPVSTDANGRIRAFQVSGLNNGTAYQVDPIKGRFFTNASNEAKTVTVTYRAVGPDGNELTNPVTETVTIGLVSELEESPMPLDGGTNESPPFLITDPQKGPFIQNGVLRPGLFWSVWTSTRGGNSDLFLQALSPRFISSPSGSK